MNWFMVEVKEMKFFVVHTYTGREKKVKELLERAIERENMKEFFGRIILPAERVTKIKKSELVSEERRLYPGYIVVEMEPTEKAINLVNAIPGVTHLLGTKTKPLPLTEKEVESILEEIEKGREKVMTEVPFNKGENVKVITGPFAGFLGTVDEINPERRRVKVMVTIFGRPTPIDLDFLEVQPI
uniref:Transcription termination/antitermination protein NusG n=1 Tax=candidate division WOR-3 bacterium TaxID=2052148 RepID=A0A7C6AA64_UNCW3